MLEHTPPIRVRSVLLQRVASLDLDAGHAEESREGRRERMRQVDNLGEGALRSRRCCRKGCSRAAKKIRGAIARGRQPPGIPECTWFHPAFRGSESSA